MKSMRYMFLFAVLFGLSACGDYGDYGLDPDDGGGSSGAHEILGLYEPGGTQSLGSDKGLMKILADEGSASYTFLSSLYPKDNLYKNAGINGGTVAIGLHADFKDGYSMRGAWFEKGATEAWYLPLVPPSADDDFADFEPTSVTVSANGYIFYLSAIKDKNYADQYWPSLVRYNPDTEQMDVAKSPQAFTLAQPEKGNDTETGLIDRYLVASPDGRYVYGKIDAMGVDFGSVHWDYTLIFRYDFQNEAYTRIGDGERSVNLYGLTSDGRYLVYKNYDGSANHFRVYNANTEVVSEGPAFYWCDVRSNPASWNSEGFCTGGDASTTTVLAFHNMANNSYVEIGRYASRPRLSQFSPDGNFIYFSFFGAEENYLCRTADLTAGSAVDTLYAYSKEITDWLIVQ